MRRIARGSEGHRGRAGPRRFVRRAPPTGPGVWRTALRVFVTLGILGEVTALGKSADTCFHDATRRLGHLQTLAHERAAGACRQPRPVVPDMAVECGDFQGALNRNPFDPRRDGSALRERRLNAGISKGSEQKPL
jgi:hypothetical protein